MARLIRGLVGLACGGAVAPDLRADPPAVEDPIPPAATVAVVDERVPYRLARAEAWAELKRIAATFETVSITSAPGLNHLAADLRAVQRRLESGGRIDLERLDPDSLVTRNRHFWRATLETARGDVLLPVFEALVWLSAGQVVRAHGQLTFLRSLTRVPEHVDQLLLRHLRNIDRGAPEMLNQDLSFASTSPPGSGRLSRLEHISTRHPGNAMIAQHILLNRLVARGVPTDPTAMTRDGEELPEFAAVVRESVPEVAVLRKQNPVFAALFQPDPDRRRDARELWSYWGEAMRADGAVSNEDLARIVAGAEQLGLPDRALSLSRLITDRSALDPDEDRARWERLLPHLIGDEDSTPILRDQARYRSPEVSFTTAASPTDYAMPARPMHPLIARKAERVLRESSYIIENGSRDDDELANAYRRRALALKDLGRWEDVDADLQRLAARDAQPEVRANVRTYLALERDQPREAWRAIESLRRNYGDPGTVALLSAAAFAREGKWARASEAYRSVVYLSDVDAERRSYAAFHAAATLRFAGGDASSFVEAARRNSPKDAWVSHLLEALLDETAARQLLDEADQGAAAQRIDRHCEAYLALAVRPGLTPEEVKSALIACVDTGRVGFIEYDLARARLDQLDPEWWSKPR